MGEKIILFGGTTEGRELAYALTDFGYDVTVSVATEVGAAELERKIKNDAQRSVSKSGTCGKIDRKEEAEPVGDELPFEIKMGKMRCGEMEEVLKDYRLCLDATHPYALEVTANLKAACERTGVRYLRVLREPSGGGCPSGSRPGCSDDMEEGGCLSGSWPCCSEDMGFDDLRMIEVKSARDAGRLLARTEGNILLTTGSKELHAFADIPRARLYVRVLPTQMSIDACMKEGIPARNIIAMFGPFTQKMNEATLEQYKIDYLVTKDSGRAGGFDEKIGAARSCGVSAVVIRRPEESGLDVAEILSMVRDGKL